jgi:hypothetical protein
MTVLLISAVILVLVIVVLAITSASIQRQVVEWQGSASQEGIKRVTLADESGGGVQISAQELAPPPPPPPPDMSQISGGSAAAKGAQIAARTEKTDFDSMGMPPLDQQMTTYLFGDNMYDESYSLDDGEFLGEMGVSISESVDMEDGRNVLAFEVWVFDAGSITTLNRVLVTEAAAENPQIMSRLSSKGEVIGVSPGTWMDMDSGNLRLQVRVADVAVRPNDRLPGVIFDRLTLEMAIWKKEGQAIPDLSQPAAVPEAAPTQAVEAPRHQALADATRPSLPQLDIPETRRQRITTGFLINYARRLYLRQPFLLKVRIPAVDPQQPAAKRTPVKTAHAGQGDVEFVHQWYPNRREAENSPDPMIRVELLFDSGDFQSPFTTLSGRLLPDRATVFEFPVKPMRNGTLFLVVRLYYQGTKWVAEREVEMMVTQDAKTEEVSSITTKKTAGGFLDYAELLAHETLSVQVSSFLNIGTAWLNFLTALVGLGLIAGFVMITLTQNLLTTLQDTLIAGGSALLSFLLLLLIPTVMGAMNRARVRRQSR